MMSKRKAEQLLGLVGAYTQKDLKTAFRKRIMKAHPDVGGSEEQMKALNEAREVIEEEFARTGASKLFVDDFDEGPSSSSSGSYGSTQSSRRTYATEDVPGGSGTVYDRIKREEAEKRREVDERQREKEAEAAREVEAAKKRNDVYQASVRSGRKAAHWVLRLTLTLFLFFLGQACIAAEVIATGNFMRLIQPGISMIPCIIFMLLALRELVFGTYAYKFFDPEK